MIQRNVLQTALARSALDARRGGIGFAPREPFDVIVSDMGMPNMEFGGDQ